jgi:two-component system, LytTR family, sensor kinase
MLRTGARRRFGAVKRAMGLLLLWSVPGVLTALQEGLLTPGGMGSFRESLLEHVPPWWVWAAATPLIMRVGQRHAAAGGAWARTLPWHIGLASLAIACHALTYLLCMRLAGALVTTASFSTLLPLFVVKVTVLGAFAYAGTLALALGLVERRRRAELEASVARGQLDALRAQVQPHFLFNALNSVAMLVRKHDSQGAVRVLSLLGDLLRASLRVGGAPEVTLAEEIAFVGAYLAVEKVRFADRLAVRFDVEPGTESASVPTFLLQPLVENAVRHGLAPRPTGGSLEVRAFRLDGRLCLEVIDDGVGLVDGAVDGVGLANVRARLEQSYADAHRFAVEPGPGGGARVHIELPFVAVTPDD